jgi:CRP-like cAMP-binding protein
MTLSGSGTIVREGKKLPGMFVIVQGSVRVTGAREVDARLGPGDVVGQMHRIFRGEMAACTYTHSEPVEMLFISTEDAMELIDRNPGLAVRISYSYL